MQITPIKTHKITKKDTDILKILEEYFTNDQASMIKDQQKGIIKEKSIIAVSSKIVAITEGRIIQIQEADKQHLIEKEADMYLLPTSNKYGVTVSIKNGMFIASAGIDESNGNGYYVLWPKNPQASANAIREYLVKKFGLTHVGVVITDSRTAPLRWGVTGVAIAYSGFSYLNSYVGKPDIFGRPLHVEKVNVADTLAASAVGVMGEGEEQTPLAVITDAPFVQFQDRNPSEEERAMLKIAMEDDIYAGLLTAVDWQKSR